MTSRRKRFRLRIDYRDLIAGSTGVPRRMADQKFFQLLLEANLKGLEGKKITKVIPRSNPNHYHVDLDFVFGDAPKVRD